MGEDDKADVDAVVDEVDPLLNDESDLAGVTIRSILLVIARL